MKTKTWRDQVHRTISELCRESYLQAGNTFPPKGRHKPYAVPQEAQELIDCLNTDDEERAKAIMLHDYEARRALSKAMKEGR